MPKLFLSHSHGSSFIYCYKNLYSMHYALYNYTAKRGLVKKYKRIIHLVSILLPHAYTEQTIDRDLAFYYLNVLFEAKGKLLNNLLRF